LPWRPAPSWLACRAGCDNFLYTLKAGPRAAACGGRPRPATPRRFRGRTSRRSQTTAALALKRALANHNSEASDLANTQASQLLSITYMPLIKDFNAHRDTAPP
jgi:hypothetical protein